MRHHAASIFLAAMATAASGAARATPGEAVRASGRTLASSQLATDVLNRIAQYTASAGACPQLDAVKMEVLPREYLPRQPAAPATSRGGHFERWTVDGCGRRQQFQVGLWPSPQGGSDFAVTPLTQPLPVAQAGGGAARAGPLSAWHGRYVWEESLGRIGGASPAEGAAAFVTYTLSLGPGQGPTGCRLDADGFQTATRIQCTATPEGGSLVVKFYRFGPDDVRGRHTVGERLLTLSREPGGLVTRLEGLAPASDATPRQGRLFRKVG